MTHPARRSTTVRTLRRRVLAAVMAGAAVTTMAACSHSATPRKAATTSASATPSPTPAAPAVWPLTGVPSGTVGPHPALAVKVETRSTRGPDRARTRRH